jgi:FkbM family methyltransferase
MNPDGRLSLNERLGHAWRVGSPRTAILALIDATFRTLRLRWWAETAPWYVGRILKALKWNIRIDGRSFFFPPAWNPFLSGLAWLGVYETAERYAIARFLPRSIPVVELGGSAGIVACVTNRLLTDPSRHAVVEANPQMIPILERNRDRNGCRFVTLHAALAYGGESIEFGVSDDFLASSLAAAANTNRVSVPAVSLAKIMTDAGYERCSVVCDIEGAEVALLKNEGALFERAVEAFLLEVHPAIVGAETVAWLHTQLGLLGFAPVWSCGDVWFYESSRAGSATRRPRSASDGLRPPR